MATHEYNLANQSGASFRSDLNDVLQAILTNNSSASAPSTTAAYSVWADTNTAKLKIRNSANDAWVELINLDGTLARDISLTGDLLLTDKIIHSGDSNTLIRFPADDTFTVETAGSERFRVDSSGKIGIGTSSVDTSFHLSGDQPKLRIESTNSLDTSSGTEEIGRIEFEGTKSSNINVCASMRVRQDGTWSTSNDFFSPTAIEFYTQDQSGSEITSPRLTITSTGLVGINSTSPSGSLHVDAASGVDGAVFDSGGTGNTNHALLVRDSGDNQLLRVNNNGNVGIGTTSPDGRLHCVTGAANDNAHVTFHASATTGTNNTGEVVKIISSRGTGNASPIFNVLTNTSTSVLAVTGSGLVGIGTTSPSVLLDLESTSPTIKLTDSDASGTPECEIRGGGGDLVLAADKDGEKDSSVIKFEIDGNVDLTINHNGVLFSTGTYNNTTSNSANMAIPNSDGQIFRSTSSRKYKTNITTLTDTLADKILSCNPVSYTSLCTSDDKTKVHYGFIAEEVDKIDTSLVFYNNEAETPEPEGVQYDRFIPALLNLVKRQKTQIETLETKVAALEAG